jgi:hypothetical protein
MKKIFVSYSKKDIEQIHSVVTDLKAAGYSIWWDRNILPGQNFRHCIDVQLDSADAVLVVWTANSVQSEWVVEEAEHARRQNKLIQLYNDTVTPQNFPKPFGTRHAISMLDSEEIISAIILKYCTKKAFDPL